MDEYLKSSNYKQSSADPCVYYRKNKKGIMIFAVYVDNKALLIAEKKRLSEAFEMDDGGEVHHILGMEVHGDRDNRILTFDQKTYLEDVLQRIGMEECKPVATPLEAGKNFHKLSENEEPADEKQYQAAVGLLNYAAIASRPDLSTAVGKLSQFMKSPSAEHWSAVKRVLRYVKGTLHLGLRFTHSESFKLTGYPDSDWAGCIESCKSTSGLVFRVGSSTISWSSEKQSVVALSSKEAEYIALCSAAQETVWLIKLFADVDMAQPEPTTVYEDNQGAICLSKNPTNHSRTKHIDVKYHYIRGMVETGIMKVDYVSTGDMVADTLTKALPRPSFEKHCLAMGVEPRLES